MLASQVVAYPLYYDGPQQVVSQPVLELTKLV